MSGVSYLITKPDFQDVGKLGQTLSEIENGTIIATIFENRKGRAIISISFGSENGNEALFDFTVITKLANLMNLLRFLGPTG